MEIARDVTLSWASQALTTSNKFITATIASVGGILNVKKLDINTGIGNDYLGILLNQFTYPFNNAGDITTYQVRALPGIPDRMFGLTDRTGSSTSHQFLYLPVQGEDGNLWLNNNLGANYAKVGASFNPANQATSNTDHNAYGSLFQWGRKPDGHELINWSNGTTGSAVITTTTSVPANEPTHPNFITDSNGANNYDWRSNLDATLWNSTSSPNNPCPEGFRVPTNAEFTTYLSAAGVTNLPTANTSSLKLPVSGLRSFQNGNINVDQNNGYYWTASQGTSNTNRSIRRVFNNPSSVSFTDEARASGISVRCIRD
jgi:uncharacterized protein (TIGR02145 family)